jgi:deoxyribose-phosphate aldolase
MESPTAQLARRVLSLVDLTELGDRATDADVVALCQKAHGPHGTTAAVCVWPRHVALAVEQLWGTNVRVATVVNFPTGDEPVEQVVAMTEQALADGADEIDLVLPYRAFLAGDVEAAAAMIDAVRAVVPADSHRLKVILETGELVDPTAIHGAAHLAVLHGADFIKTSTGKVQPAATPPVTLCMLEAIRDHWLATGVKIGMKPAGGIRTSKQALHYLVLVKETLGADWLTPDLFRFGASSLVNDLLMQLKKEETGRYRSEEEFTKD